LFSDAGTAILNAKHYAEQQHLKARLLFTDKAAQSPHASVGDRAVFSGLFEPYFSFSDCTKFEQSLVTRTRIRTLLDQALVFGDRVAALLALTLWLF